MRLIYLGATLVAAAQLVGCAKGDDAIGGAAGAGAFAGFGGTNADGGGAGGAAGGGSGGVGNVGNAGGTGGVGNAGGSAGTGSCTPPVSGGECDTFPQCGCQTGEACIATVPTGVTQCTADGTVDPYQECDATKLCKAGYACVGTACKQYCDQNTDCASSSCFQVQYDVNGTPTPVPQMKVCASGCALENPAGICAPGLGCYANSDTPPVTDCAPAGSNTGPGGCTAPTQADSTLCAPGYGCVLPDPNDKSIGDCRKWCRTGFSTDCPSAGACTGFQTPLFVDGLEYGVCP